MKVSIVTATNNNKDCIERCINSVLSQTYKDIEHIIVDNLSSDGTMDIVHRYEPRIAKIISERDSGPYDAMNKGIRAATGEVVALLHSDDMYSSNDVIKEAVEVFIKHKVDSLYGDLLYVGKCDTNKVIRYWKAGTCSRRLLRKGWMPPHPTFFVKKAIYEKYGHFREEFRISADYELILRFLYKEQISTYYIKKVLIKMSVGGQSNRNIFLVTKKTLEDYRISRIYKISPFAVLVKNLRKIPQFFNKPAVL